MGATSANLLTTIGRQKLYLALAIPACSLGRVATFGAASSGGGIAAVALASGRASRLFAAALVVVAGRFWLPSFRRRLAFVLRLHLCAAPILVTAALVWTGDHYGWPVVLKAVVAVLVLGLFGLGIAPAKCAADDRGHACGGRSRRPAVVIFAIASPSQMECARDVAAALECLIIPSPSSVALLMGAIPRRNSVGQQLRMVFRRGH